MLKNEVVGTLKNEAIEIARETGLPCSIIVLFVGYVIMEIRAKESRFESRKLLNSELKDMASEKKNLIGAVNVLLNIRLGLTQLTAEVAQRTRQGHLQAELHYLLTQLEDAYDEHKRIDKGLLQLWGDDRLPRRSTDFSSETKKALVSLADLLIQKGMSARGASARIIVLFESARSPLVDSLGMRGGAIKSLQQNLMNWRV